MRQLKQPGPEQFPRILVSPAEPAGDVIITLAEGDDLLNGLRSAITRMGHRTAGIELLGGTLSALHYFTGMPDPTGQRLATYGDPTPLDGPITLLGGNAILGLDAEGVPMVHCHAVMVDRHGKVHGGHLPPGGCRVGAGGVRALAAIHDGAGFGVKPDVETNYSIFHPVGLTGAEEAAE